MTLTNNPFDPDTFWGLVLLRRALNIALKEKRVSEVIITWPEIPMRALVAPYALIRQNMKLMIDQGLVKV
jgi:hypothetical protein